MKTPDEIKKGAAICNALSGCDVIAYIRQLESTYSQVSKALCGKENAALEELLQAVEQLKSRLAQAERERDAAVNDIEPKCDYCAFVHNPYGEAPCPTEEELETDAYCYGFKWRGVCEENTKEDEHGNQAD